MYVTGQYNKVLFSILYSLTGQPEVDFGIALLQSVTGTCHVSIVSPVTYTHIAFMCHGCCTTGHLPASVNKRNIFFYPSCVQIRVLTKQLLRNCDVCMAQLACTVFVMTPHCGYTVRSIWIYYCMLRKKKTWMAAEVIPVTGLKRNMLWIVTTHHRQGHQKLN